MKRRINKQIVGMYLTRSVIIFLMQSFIFVTHVMAQEFDDWNARSNVSLKYKFNKNLHIAATYYLYMDHNMKHFKKSVISGEIGYKVNSWMKAGFEYRHGTGYNEHYSDLRYSFTFDANLLQKWKVKYRPMLQQEFVSLNRSYLAEHPIKYFLRNRITLSYDVARSLELYIFTENYLKPDDGEMFFHRQKSAFGAAFEINQRSEIGTRFEVINKKKGKMIARPNLSYTYTFGHVKRKK